MLALEPLRAGRVYYLLIADILQHPTCDGWGVYCNDCRKNIYVNAGTVFWWAEYGPVTGNWRCECPHYSIEEHRAQQWGDVLASKREDDQYEYLVESIWKNGFIRPIHTYASDDGYVMGNGHHRLAAAMELGYETVPVLHEVESWEYDKLDERTGSVNPMRDLDNSVLHWSQPRLVP